MKLVNRLGVGLFVCSVVIIGCSVGAQLAKSKIAHPGQNLFNGYANPEVDCYRCHGGDGHGTWRGPDLSKKVPPLSDEAILKVIDEGVFVMPAFGDVTTGDQRKEILAWLRAEFGGSQQEIETISADAIAEEVMDTAVDSGDAVDTAADTEASTD